MKAGAIITAANIAWPFLTKMFCVEGKKLGFMARPSRKMLTEHI
jgi:hypothetical protein